jgi:hypothetical protein
MGYLADLPLTTPTFSSGQAHDAYNIFIVFSFIVLGSLEVVLALEQIWKWEEIFNTILMMMTMLVVLLVGGIWIFWIIVHSEIL